MAKKLVCGVGINDASHKIETKVGGKRVICPFYKAWKNMLERCYSPKLQAKRPTYAGCHVDPRWHRLSAFRSWMLEQDWHGNQIDKDLLFPGNKVYGPDTCVFVSSQINNLLTDHGAARGGFPLGVCLDAKRGKFRARVCISGRRKHLGLYTEALQAHHAYQLAKAKAISDAAETCTDPRVRSALLARSDQLLADRAAGRETIDFRRVEKEAPGKRESLPGAVKSQIGEVSFRSNHTTQLPLWAAA
jgi:hypothetical protein